MEVSVVRQRVQEVLRQAKRTDAERRADHRAQSDQATREYEAFLQRIGVPLIKQVANVLRAEGYAFDVFTPGNTVRLIAGNGADNYLELALDTKGAAPKLLGRSSSSRGGNVNQTELVLNATADISALTEEDLLEFVLSEIETLV
jgi:hypothetical protein